DGEVLAVRAERGDAAALPAFRGDALFLAGIEIAYIRLIIADEENRFAVRRPASLRAFGHEFRVRAVAVHHPDFGKPAAQRRGQDALAVGGETGVGVGVAT